MSGRFFSQEFGRNIRRSPLSHLGSLVMSTLLFVLFNLFWVGSRMVDNHFTELFGQLQMETFVNESVNDDVFQKYISESQQIAGVTRVQVITKKLARERLTDQLGKDFLGENETNPLPRSMVLSLEKGFPNSLSLDSLAQAFTRWPGVIQISYSRVWLQNTEEQLAKVEQALQVVMTAVLGGAMLNAALLAGLIVRSKTRDIRQMRLLGASGIFLGGPHVAEGALLSGFSAALSWGIILAAQRHFQIAEVSAALPPYEQMAYVTLAAVTVGVFGSALSVRLAIRKAR